MDETDRMNPHAGQHGRQNRRQRIIGRLSTARVRTAKPRPGRRALVIGDGGGLWLQCTLGDGGHVRRSWTFRYELNGKRREMGLGPVHTLGLSEARGKARGLRQQLLDGIDPLEAREAAHRARLADAARTVTFRRCAELYFNLHEQGWGPSHRQQWTASLRDYVHPVIGEMSVADVDQAAVIKIVEPIWKTKTVTAARIRGRIEAVLDYAAANNFRSGDNPARALLAALPKQAKTHKVEHYAALPWREIPGLMTELREDAKPLSLRKSAIVL
jgi:Arm DNA-binding domain